MPFLLHERASLDLDNVPYLARPLTTNRSVWNRLVELVSLARSLDPSLPPQLRFFKNTPDDPITVPFVTVLTHSTDPDLRENALDDPTHTVRLDEALRRALPEHVWRSEMAAILGSDEMNFAGPMDAAIYTAFRDVQIELHTVVEVDPVLNQKVRHVSSGNFRAPDLAFMNNPDLARAAWLAPVKEGQEVGAFARVRAGVQRVRDLLSRPMAEASEAERAELPRLVSGLNGRHEARSFEQRMEHGWVAFAMAHRAGDWTPTLLAMGANPAQNYGKVSPMALAIATNDATGLNALLATRSVSANQTFEGVPPMFDQTTQRWLKGLNDIVMPAIVLASVMGANEVANVLLHRGADVDRTTDTGRFPLLVAAMGGDAAMVRTLVAHGASLTQEDAAHRLPEETIPQLDADDGQAQAMEALYEQLSGWRVDGTRPAVEPLPASFGSPAPHRLPSDEDAPARIATLAATDEDVAHVAPAVRVDEAAVLAAEAAQPAKPKTVRKTKATAAGEDAPKPVKARLPSRAAMVNKLDGQTGVAGTPADAPAPATPKAKRRTTGTGT